MAQKIEVHGAEVAIAEGAEGWQNLMLGLSEHNVACIVDNFSGPNGWPMLTLIGEKAAIESWARVYYNGFVIHTGIGNRLFLADSK